MTEYITETVVCTFDGEPGGDMKHASIDVTVKEEIVRCIDCKRFDTDDYGCTWCSWVCAAVLPDDYCSWGERKADE